MTPNQATDATITPTRRARRLTNRDLLIIVLVIAVGYLIYEQVAAKLDTIEAQQQTQEFAEPVDQLCRDDPSARRRIGDDKCDRAADVQDDPPPVVAAPRDGRDGADGDDGPAGRGITATAVVEGRLVITYTDGTREDKGVVVGTDGTAGIPGNDGVPGRGVSSSTITDDGDLVISYTDGTAEVVGRVVGRDGRGIERTAAVDGRLIVTYTDGTFEDVGPLPPGPAGRGVVTIDLDLDRCEFTVHYTSGDPEVKPITGCESDPSPTTTVDPFLPVPTS